MNTEKELEELKSFKTVKNPENLNGRWKLTYTLVNSQGIEAFSGKRLIGHPEVGIDNSHVNIDLRYKTKKSTNPRLKLVNLDHIVTTDIDEQDYIDKLIGKLTLEGGPESIGLEKLRFILCALNMPYFDSKYMRDKQKEKKLLRSSLKAFVRSSLLNAKKVNKIIDEIGQAKYAYEIREMVRLEVLSIHGGMYKYNSVAIGSALESVIKYFGDNIEIYQEMAGMLYDRLKQERGY